jgi:hypothetical protein
MDMLSGLVWLKNANCKANLAGINKTETLNWSDAEKWVSGVKSGVCGLTDGSVEGKWRQPTKDELTALSSGIEAVLYKSPALFRNVQSYFYWSATPGADYTTYAWIVGLGDGRVGNDVKTSTYYVWPVR